MFLLKDKDCQIGKKQNNNDVLFIIKTSTYKDTKSFEVKQWKKIAQKQIFIAALLTLAKKQK